jgi:hypothetical protein
MSASNALNTTLNRPKLANHGEIHRARILISDRHLPDQIGARQQQCYRARIQIAADQTKRDVICNHRRSERGIVPQAFETLMAFDLRVLELPANGMVAQSTVVVRATCTELALPLAKYKRSAGIERAERDVMSGHPRRQQLSRSQKSCQNQGYGHISVYTWGLGVPRHRELPRHCRPTRYVTVAPAPGSVA